MWVRECPALGTLSLAIKQLCRRSSSLVRAKSEEGIDRWGVFESLWDKIRDDAPEGARLAAE